MRVNRYLLFVIRVVNKSKGPRLNRHSRFPKGKFNGVNMGQRA